MQNEHFRVRKHGAWCVYHVFVRAEVQFLAQYRRTERQKKKSIMRPDRLIVQLVIIERIVAQKLLGNKKHS